MFSQLETTKNHFGKMSDFFAENPKSDTFPIKEPFPREEVPSYQRKLFGNKLHRAEKSR